MLPRVADQQEPGQTEQVDSPEINSRDDLDPARGIVWATVASLIFWVPILYWILT